MLLRQVVPEVHGSPVVRLPGAAALGLTKNVLGSVDQVHDVGDDAV